MEGIVATLRELLGPNAVLADELIGAKYSVDYSAENPQPPLAVVRPRTTDEVAAILRACSDAGQRVVVQGGLTGLSGGATPRVGELALSLERMTGVIDVDAKGMTLTAWAGTPLEQIQRAAADADCLFPLDFGARGSCHIGGAIATNAGGNQVIRFGMARNLVLGLEVVLADGTVLTSMNTMLKNNAGYDLEQLFIGTEGTLGVITRCALRLHPLLPSRATALCYGVTGRYAGSVSAEHGIGQIKTGYLHHSRAPAELATVQRLKHAFDPRGSLNMGRVLPSSASG